MYNNEKKLNHQYYRSDEMNGNNMNNFNNGINGNNMNNLGNTNSMNSMSNLGNNSTMNGMNNGGTNGNNSSTQSNTSFVKILHASPDAPAVDIYVNDNIAVENLAFTEATGYLPLEPGTYNIKVFATGTTDNAVIDTDVEIPARTRLTVAAVGNLENITLIPIPENVTPDMLQGSNVRVVHLSPDAPAVDVSLPNGTVVFSDVEFGEVTNYINVPRGVYTFQIKPTGSDTVVMTISNVSLMPNFYYTIYVLGLLEGEPSLQVFATLNRTPGVLTTNFREEFFPLEFQLASTSTTMSRSPKGINKLMDEFCGKNDVMFVHLEKFGLNRKIAEYLTRVILDYVDKNHNRYKGTIRRKANMAGRDLSLLCPWIFEIMSCLGIPNKKVVEITIIIISFGFENL